VARIEQNFEQQSTGIEPGDDIVVDWGVGRVVRMGSRAVDLGISGFATWQISTQQGGTDVDTSGYHYLGIGPEASIPLTDALSMRLRAHWEFDTHNAIRGNNFWVIFNYRW
jgi:hypothetical protein